MADSSEKVSFRVDMQCSSLRAEAFLVFEKGSQPTHRQQITDMRPTVGRLLAEDFRKSGKRQSADYRPTVGRLSADCRPTVGQLLADCRPTVGRLLAHSRPTVFWGSCSSKNQIYLSQSTLKVKLIPVKKFACKLVCFTILEISISGKSNETLLIFKHQRSTDWQDVPFCQLPTSDVPSRKLSVLQWVCPD